MKLVMACVFVVVMLVPSSAMLCPVMYSKGRSRICFDELLPMSVTLHLLMRSGCCRDFAWTGGKTTMCFSYSTCLSCRRRWHSVIGARFCRSGVLMHIACMLLGVVVESSLFSSPRRVMKLMMMIAQAPSLCRAADKRMRSCGLIGCRCVELLLQKCCRVLLIL